MIGSWTNERPPVALVTGASRGIGEGIARHLHTLGAGLLVVGRDASTLEALASSLPPSDATVSVQVADLATREGVESLATRMPPVDILINCAGAILGTDGWSAEGRGDITTTFDLNYAAAHLLAQAVVPHMAATGWGRIINVTSIYGRLGSPYVASYSASKAALLSLTRSLAVGLGPDGVTANCVSPGNIETEMTLSAGADYIDEVMRKTPVGRLGRVDEVSLAVQFLIESPFVNGAEIVVDGGLSLVGG